MALIQFSNLVNDIRGAVAGNVFSRNRSGAYVRGRTTPLNPQSPAQMAARSAFGALTQQWRNLTVAARAAWNAAVEDYPYLNKLGQSRLYSGEQLYIKLNRNLQSIGEAAIDVPQAPSGVGSVDSMVVTAVASTGVITVTPVINDPDSTSNFSVQATRPLSAGKNYIGLASFRSITSSTQAALESGLAITTPYAAAFGPIASAVGSKIFVRVFGVNVETGQASAPFIVSTIITA